MKYLTHFIFIFILGFSMQAGAQLTAEVSIVDLQVNNSDKSVAFSLAINTQNAGDILYLANADFILEFNSQYFSNPEFSVETKDGEGYCTFVSDTYTDPAAAATKTNVQDPAHNNLKTELIRGNRLIINYIADFTDNPAEFQQKTPKIDERVGQHILGRFKVSGISDIDGNLGLTWLCSGLQRTKISAYIPNTSTSSSQTVQCSAIRDISLPIVLKDFWLVAEDAHLDIHWETLTETNFHGFFLERSLNGIDFQDIRFLEGRGGESTGASYNYTDSAVLPGQIYYYRLRMKDLDGKTSRSKMIQGMIKRKIVVSLGPNPAKNQTQLLFDAADDGPVQIAVYNSIGQQMHLVKQAATRGLNKVDIGLKGWASGMYWVEVVQQDSKGGSRLVILNGEY